MENETTGQVDASRTRSGPVGLNYILYALACYLYQYLAVLRRSQKRLINDQVRKLG